MTRGGQAATLLLLSAACLLGGPVTASDGAGYIPAHRTRDGSWVPANVPPSSARSHPSRRAATGRAQSERQSAPAASTYVSPLFIQARPLHP